MSVGARVGWAMFRKRVTLIAVFALLVVGLGTTLAVKHVFAAPPYAYDFVPGIGPDPALPPPIPNNGSGDASNSVIYPGQVMKFNMTVANNGTAPGSPTEETAKVFMLDPNPGMPYYRAEANCSGTCYDDPGHTTYPQPGIVWPHQGFIYEYRAFPPINPGQTVTAPPQNGAAAPYSFTFTVPNNAAVGRKICFYTHTNPGNPDNLNPDGTSNGGYPDTGFGSHCYIVQALGNGACDGIAINPAILDPGTSFQITGRVRYNNASAANYILNTPGMRFYVNIVGPGVNRSYPNVTPVTTGGTSVLSATTGVQAPTNRTGIYTVTYGVASGPSTVNCSTQFTIAKRPYFQVLGGDIAAGAGMSYGGSACGSAGALGTNNNASIVSWNRGTTGGYGGAGSEYAALAVNHLQSFASGRGSGLAPLGLSFANTGGGTGQVDVNQQLYGGKFGSANCQSDFWENAHNIHMGDLTIDNSTFPNPIPNGAKLVRYVEGNVYITRNIDFTGAYPNLAAVPSLALVVRGNIYVDKNVERLDGFFIAMPRGTTPDTGFIKTCAVAMSTPVGLDRNLQSQCDRPLTIQGGVVAKQAWLNRTAGTLTGSAAETFEYSPEFWVSAPAGNSLNASLGNEYDSITSLPPVL